jgi:hypothetical protein
MKRNCPWMSGPAGTEVKISAAKWWLAISRDVLAKDFRRQMWSGRPPVACQRTPKFVSPLEKKF